MATARCHPTCYVRIILFKGVVPATLGGQTLVCFAN